MTDHSILVGDIITIAGVFRDGAMDEHRKHETDNVQVWRVAAKGGTVLEPVLPTGEPDIESYWFGRISGIVNAGGRYGVVSQPTFKGRN